MQQQIIFHRQISVEFFQILSRQNLLSICWKLLPNTDYPDNRGFPWHTKKERKEKPLKMSCQNPVEHTYSFVLSTMPRLHARSRLLE